MTTLDLCDHLTGRGLQTRTVGLQGGPWLHAWAGWHRQSLRLMGDVGGPLRELLDGAHEVIRLSRERREEG